MKTSKPSPIPPGAQLRQFRLAVGATIAEAAAVEGVSKRLWEYWEVGRKLPPAASKVRTLEKLLARWEGKAAVNRPPMVIDVD